MNFPAGFATTSLAGIPPAIVANLQQFRSQYQTTTGQNLGQ